MSADDYNIVMNRYLQNLQEHVNNREEVERSTILQAESALWLELRRCLVTVSSFGKQLENQQNIINQKCGLFIDEKFFFLGASPDGIFEEGIIEIKCPISAFGMNVEDVV
ncbi:hypothetical protein ACJJTC_001133 [Scirpophaga incertulas]